MRRETLTGEEEVLPRAGEVRRDSMRPARAKRSSYQCMPREREDVLQALTV